MKLGAEPKKLVILGVLLVAAGYFLYTNSFQSQTASRAPATPPPERAAARVETLPETGPVPRAEPQSSSQSALQEFRPSLKPKKPGEQLDLSSIDPTLRLDLLAKLEDVKMQGGDRSLFEFAPPPLPKTPEPKVIPKPIQTVALPPPKPPEAESKPAPPPIPLKFFGYTTAFKQSNKRAFFLDGDEILVGSEGDVLKKRYRVVRIGVNSVVMEDLDFKAEQTLPIEPQTS